METNCKNCAAPIPNNRKCEYCGTNYAPEKPLPRFQHGGSVQAPPLSLDSAGYQSGLPSQAVLMLGGIAAAGLMMLKKR